MVGFMLKDFVTLLKKGGIIDDSTGKPMDFGAVLGFCTLHNNTTGVLLNKTEYELHEAYIGEDKLIHYSEWVVSGVVTKKMKMYEAKGIDKFNASVSTNSRKIRKAMLLSGEVVR